MLFDVRLRTAQTLFFAAPQGNTNSAPWFHIERLKNSRGFHHDRAADGVVSGAGRRVPRIKVTTEHDHFVSFIGAANFADRVVRRRAFRISTVDDIELENHVSAVIENARYASEVFIAHHNCWNDLADVETSVIERTNLTKFTPRIIHANKRSI